MENLEAQVDKYVNYAVDTLLGIITVPLSMEHNHVLPHLVLLTFYFMGNVLSAVAVSLSVHWCTVYPSI